MKSAQKTCYTVELWVLDLAVSTSAAPVFDRFVFDHSQYPGGSLARGQWPELCVYCLLLWKIEVKYAAHFRAKTDKQKLCRFRKPQDFQCVFTERTKTVEISRFTKTIFLFAVKEWGLLQVLFRQTIRYLHWKRLFQNKSSTCGRERGTVPVTGPTTGEAEHRVLSLGCLHTLWQRPVPLLYRTCVRVSRWGQGGHAVLVCDTF